MRMKAAVSRRKVTTALLAATFAQKDVHICLRRILQIIHRLVWGESLELRSEI